MFEKLAKTPVTKSVSTLPQIPQTTAFVECVRDQGFRLSYGALALAARELGEDQNQQIPAQRGGKLVRVLPEELQPFVCKKSGKYSKGVEWSVEVPGNLVERPVITDESVEAAIEIWRERS